ncbi:MAG: GntR family transcriptional regulator [Chloroflexi bacterium]|nr:GntR family transcriptional regulator [Chloroflexota bacterium]
MNIHSDLSISRTDGRPMYLQIIEQIKQRIAIGDWPAGSEIPSIRQLAIDLRISVITVKRAYFELEHEGIIVTQHGKGSFVATNTQLSRQLWEDELDSYLEQVARLAALLGLSNEQLIQRLQASTAQQQQELL